MKRAALAPLEWVSSLTLEVKGTSLATMLENPEHVRKILLKALTGHYLPSGVLLILAAEVTPFDARLKVENTRPGLGSSGLVAKGLKQLPALMEGAIAWNRENRSSYFQQISKYTGTHPSVAVFRRSPVARTRDTAFHVVQFVFQDDYGSPGSHRRHLEYEDLSLRTDAHPTSHVVTRAACKMFMSASSEGDPEFASVAQSIADDQAYLDHVATFISHANLVLAAPRMFHGSADFQRRLGTMGLNVLFHPEVVIDRDLLTRVYLLADRLNAMFHLSTAAHLEGRFAGATTAFGIVEHSLGNVLGQKGVSDVRLQAMLEIEELNLQGAKAIFTAHDKSRGVQFHVGTAEKLALALQHLGPEFTMDLSALEGLTLDPRFWPLLIELARNQRKTSLSKLGSLTITVTDRLATVTLISDCAHSDATALKTAIETFVAGTGKVRMRGVPVLLTLSDALLDPDGRLQVEIGTGSHIEAARTNLPASAATVSLHFGKDLVECLRKTETDRNDAQSFRSRLVISGLRVSTTNQP